MLPARTVTDPAHDSVIVQAIRQTGQMNTANQRRVDTVLFDLGGVLMKNGRQSDLVKRFPPEHGELALRIFMGDYVVC
jgi:hypothetical protein